MSTTPNDENATLRESVAAAVFDAERRNGFGRSQDDYFEVADAVLDALGLEQVGWLHGPFDQFSRMHEVNPHAPGWRSDCSPVYRLRPASPHGRCPTCGGVGPDRVDTDFEGGVEFACGDEWHDEAANGSSEAPR